jgi:hypothetical protein
MHLNTSNVQIPPDSTGKRLSTFKRTSLFYDNLQPGQQFFVGDIISTTGGSGTITGVNVAGFGANSGQLFLTEVAGTFTDNEQISVVSVYAADVNTTTGDSEPPVDLYYQNVVLVDSNNPEFRSSFTDQNFLRVAGPQVSADTSGYEIHLNNVPAFTFNFDYVADAIDPEYVTEEAKLKYTNGVNIAGGFSVGDLVRGDTSGVFGIVQSSDLVNNILYLEDVTSALLQPFVPGETIRNMSISTEESAEVVSSGDVGSDELTKSLTLSTGGTVDGCGASITSQFYVPLCRNGDTEVTFAVSQTAATPGVTRRFGLFNEENGYFWEILEANGTNTDFDASGGENTGGNTIVCVAHRSNSSGSVVSDFIPQNAFNVNQLDGSDNQGFVLDFSKTNVYFITIPNNGVGKARFGVYNNSGEKIVCHEFVFYNNNAYAPNPTSSLPFRAEVLNNGSGATGQETVLRINKIGVFKQTFEEHMPSFQHANAQRDVRHIDATAGEIPIMGVKAMAARGPIADVNRSYTQLESIQVSNLDDRIDRTFDASADVDAGTEQITITNHGLTTGTPVFYRANGNTALSGLTDYGIYYAIVVDDNDIKLASTYMDALEGTEINIAAGVLNHKIVGLAAGPALLRIRKSSHVADAVWRPHNANVSNTEWSDGMTGFQIGELITIGSGGTGYTVGDILELDGGIANHREAVLEVCEVNAGVITRVRIAPTSAGHGTEVDGSSNANYGSYNGKFSSSVVGHKANGVGFSSTTGSSAVFVASVAWGHGWWWKSHYGEWADWSFGGDQSDDVDIAFNNTHFQNMQQNQVLTIQLQNTEKKSISIASTLGWKEHI